MEVWAESRALPLLGARPQADSAVAEAQAILKPAVPPVEAAAMRVEMATREVPEAAVAVRATAARAPRIRRAPAAQAMELSPSSRSSVARFVISQTATLDGYLRDLSKKLAETP